MVQRKMELRDRVKAGENDDKGDLKLVPCSKKSKAEDGSSRAHAACFEALINAGAAMSSFAGSATSSRLPDAGVNGIAETKFWIIFPIFFVVGCKRSVILDFKGFESAVRPFQNGIWRGLSSL